MRDGIVQESVYLPACESTRWTSTNANDIQRKFYDVSNYCDVALCGDRNIVIIGSTRIYKLFICYCPQAVQVITGWPKIVQGYPLLQTVVATLVQWLRYSCPK